MSEPQELDPVPFPALQHRFLVVDPHSGGAEGWAGTVVDPRGGPRRFLKVLDAGFDPDEASLLVSLRHPSIPPILEIGDAGGGQRFLLREFVEGQSLDSVYGLDEDSLVDLGVRLLETLSFVHMRGVLHLDVKPGNVIRRAEGAAVDYALVDFGLGCREGDRAGGSTPLYVAPEILAGVRPDARADLYSLGVLLLACARPSSWIPPLVGLHARVLRNGFLAAVGIDEQDLPLRLRRVLPRLLAVEPRDRFPDAFEALEALAGRGGRPSIASLRPDPVALYSTEISRALAEVSESDSLEVRGQEVDVCHAVALHAAVELGRDGTRVALHTEPDGARVEREGASSKVELELGPVDEVKLAGFLQRALALPEDRSGSVALALLAACPARSIGEVAARLEALAGEGAIVSDGPRWLWPDALGGRVIDLGPEPTPFELDATALREAAATGRGAAAEMRLRAAIREGRIAAAEELDLRAALADGLLDGGEPARALAFAVDLPTRRARALFDMGRVDEAELEIQRADSEDVAVGERERLFACLEHARGRHQEAMRRLERLIERDRDPRHRIVLASVLIALGRVADAESMMDEVLQVVETAGPPYVAALARTNRAEALRRMGRKEAARDEFEQALVAWQELGHTRHSATVATNLGILFRDAGDHTTALELQRRARRMFEHVGDDRSAVLTEVGLALTAHASGDFDGAVRRLEEVRTRLDVSGASDYRSLVELKLARSRLAAGDREGARQAMAAIGDGLTERHQLELAELRDQLKAASRGDVGGEVATASSESVPIEVFRTFLAINRALASAADLGQAMNSLLDSAVVLVGGQSGYVVIMREDGIRREFRSGRDDGSAFSRSMVHRAMELQRVQTSGDVLEARELREMPSVRNLSGRSAICAPFRTPSGTDGALYIEHASVVDLFGDRERRHLEVLADQAAIAVDRMLRDEALADELAGSRRHLAAVRRQSRDRRMLGKSPPMRALERAIERLAGSELPVLIRGETGSGKELVARAIHAASGRADEPFVAQNCGAIPEHLIESELFGHEKGAFTGADAKRDGLLELASGGTLFLDEIGDTPMSLQVKLLRALQEGAIRRVGGAELRPIDVRLISATHRDLQGRIREGAFREDLYYRVVGVELSVPPLRERGDDIVLLAKAFLDQLNREYRRAVCFDDVGLRELEAYPWPGNVRELRQVISRAFVLADGDTIESFRLEAAAVAQPVENGAPMSLKEAEARAIRRALDHTGGDKTKAAKILGISRASLYDRLRRMHDDAPASD